MNRVLAVDLGTRRLGLALSDPSGTLAAPLATIAHRNRRSDLSQIVRLAEAHQVERIVVGCPRNMDGTRGPAALRAEAFAAALRRMARTPVEMWDERLTTVSAERALLASNVGRTRRRDVRDRVAAAFILQAYLDARRPREAGTAPNTPLPAKHRG
jgi:putative pre-16S rRNA nuclease